MNKLLSAYECTYRQLFIRFVECVIISLPNHVSLTGRLPPSRLCTCLCKYSLPLSPILPHYPLLSLTIPYSPSLSSILPHYPLLSLTIPYSPSLFPKHTHYSFFPSLSLSPPQCVHVRMCERFTYYRSSHLTRHCTPVVRCTQKQH